MLRRANPNKETTDWRAVCGKTACTVRRAGKMRVFPDPYQQSVQVRSVSKLAPPDVAPQRRLTKTLNITASRCFLRSTPFF